jgi:hypothetical protein
MFAEDTTGLLWSKDCVDSENIIPSLDLQTLACPQELHHIKPGVYQIAIGEESMYFYAVLVKKIDHDSLFIVRFREKR